MKRGNHGLPAGAHEIPAREAIKNRLNRSGSAIYFQINRQVEHTGCSLKIDTNFEWLHIKSEASYYDAT